MTEKMKKYRAATCALLLSFSFAACGLPASSGYSPADSVSDSAGAHSSPSSSGQTEEEKENEWQNKGGYAYVYYPQFGRDVMPIGAWCAPPSPYGSYTENHVTLENYAVLAQSGINSVYGLYEQAQDRPSVVLDALDFCEECNVVYLVRDTRILAVGQEPELLEYFEAYMKKPAYGGNLIVDEPGTKQFSSLAALGKVWKEQPATKNKLMYANMLPSYASENQLINGAGGGSENGKISYTEYIDDYLARVKPPMFSFDFYPFNGNNTDFQRGYFQQIYDVKTRVEKVGIPFWTFAQIGYFDGENTRRMPESELLWQINTALACGAKGIQYFNYWQPYEIPGNNNAFVDKEGNKVYLYDYGVRANRQIAAVDEVLMKSANMGVIQVGNSPDEIPAGAKITSFRSLTEATGGDALVGCFDFRGKTAFYIAANALTKNCTATLRFSETVKAKITVDAVTREETGESLNISLEAGNGALVVLE